MLQEMTCALEEKKATERKKQLKEKSNSFLAEIHTGTCLWLFANGDI